MPRRPQNRQELLDSLECEWERRLPLAEALTDEQMLAPDAGGWSPKDNLAHLSEWMNGLRGCHLDRRPAQRVMRVPEAATRGWEMEVINPVLFARNKDRSRRQVMSRPKRTYRRLIARLRAMPFRELLKPRHADDPRRRLPLRWVLGGTVDHFREQRLAIQPAVARTPA